MTDLARRVISEYCRAGNGNPADRLRSLIRIGLRTGRIPHLDGVRFSDVKVVNGILENFKSLGFFDFNFIGSVKSDLISSISDDTEALRFMSNISQLGFYDEDVVTQIITRIIRSGGHKKLSPHDVGKLLSILSRQQIRNSSLVLDLVSRAYDDMDAPDKVKAIHSLSCLGLPTGDLKFPAVSDDIESGLVFLEAMILSPDLMKDNSVFKSQILPTVEKLSERFGGTSVNMEALGPRDGYMIRKMSLVWYALNFAYPDEYNLLPGSCKQLLATAAQGLERNRIRSETGFIQDVSKQLFAMNLRHNTCVDKGPFSLDIEEVGEKVIWDCDKPIRYYGGVDGGMRTSYYVLRDRILKAMGYKVVHIPHWHWSRLSNKKTRADYCRMSRFLAVCDARESVADTSRFGGSLYEGEYFFKKEQPKKPWSWHGHSSCPVRVSL